MYPDSNPDPAVFVIDLQEVNKKLILKKFFCLLLFEGIFTSFLKDKMSKRNHKTAGIKVSIPLTNGSGSRRPKNIRI
jgi:hypothetical protein